MEHVKGQRVKCVKVKKGKNSLPTMDYDNTYKQNLNEKVLKQIQKCNAEKSAKPRIIYILEENEKEAKVMTTEFETISDYIDFARGSKAPDHVITQYTTRYLQWLVNGQDKENAPFAISPVLNDKIRSNNQNALNARIAKITPSNWVLG